jgi:hypothetical protein
MLPTFNSIAQNLPAGEVNVLLYLADTELAILYKHATNSEILGYMQISFSKNNSINEQVKSQLNDLANKSIAWHKVFLVVDVAEQSLIPSKFYKEETNKAVLELLYSDVGSFQIFSEYITAIDAQNVYRVNTGLVEAIAAALPNAIIQHATSLQINKALLSGTKVFCQILDRKIKYTVVKEDGLVLVNYANYQAPTDVCYALLRACEFAALDVHDVEVQLTGLIDVNSNLYNELQKFFGNIHIDNQPIEEVAISNDLEQVPYQYIKSLINLFTCV